MRSAKRKHAGVHGSFRTKNARNFALEIRVRGRTELLHEEFCEGLEDAVRIGEKWFRAFQARNPWFVQDSKRNRIFILLDPVTETLFPRQIRPKLPPST